MDIKLHLQYNYCQVKTEEEEEEEEEKVEEEGGGRRGRERGRINRNTLKCLQCLGFSRETMSNI